MNILDEKRKLLARPGFHMGDGGDSQQSTATTATTTTTVTDKRAVADNGGMVLGDGASVTTTDLGSLAASRQIAEAAILGATKIASEANVKAGALADTALELSAKTVNELKGAYESGGKVLAVGAVIVVGYLLITEGKKK